MYCKSSLHERGRFLLLAAREAVEAQPIEPVFPRYQINDLKTPHVMAGGEDVYSFWYNQLTFFEV